jgi:oligopeptide transport system substrate-binding protein
MKPIVLFLTAFYFLTACSSGKNQKIFEHAGGTFSMSLDAEPATYIPREVTDYYASTVLNQVMEGLVSLNPENLAVKPQLAESWSVSGDGLRYEFKLRKNVLFHPHETFKSDDDRLLTMEDVIHTFEIAAKKDKKGLPTPAYTSVFKGTIKGIDAFHEGKASKIAGLTTKGNKLIIELNQQDANFINKLANTNAAICSRKICHAAVENAMIGTGPFRFEAYQEEEGMPGKIILKRNEDYYMQDKDGNTLPYLDELNFIVETRKLEQLDLFEKGETQLILTLPSSRITAMLEGRIRDFNAVPPLFILRNNPLLATNYYFFNMRDPRFKDPRVRQAFNYAINREKITREVLRGQSYEDGIYGIVPPINASFRGYDFNAIKESGYGFDPEKAKALLAEAGYANGTGFGSVTLRVNIGDIHSAVAEEIANQISQTLGINVNIDGSSFEQKTHDAEYLKGDIFGSSWYADYCSPETFLLNFYGKIVPESTSVPSTLNQSRYVNPRFDELFETAKTARKHSDQLKGFEAAEKELLKDPPMMVIWYSGDIQLIYSKVRNLQDNPMNYFVFKEVYLKDWTKQEYENRLRK